MDWEAVLAEVIETVSRIVITICIPYALNLIRKKLHNEKVNKYIDRAENVVLQCVDYVSQTYVDGLKAEGKFGEEQQKIAFDMSKNYIMKMLDSNAKEAVIEVFGDLEIWAKTMIESSVRNSINNAIIPVEQKGSGQNGD